MTDELEAKKESLLRELRDYGRLIVAYSGGVDSAYLAWAAYRSLGSEMRAVLADSPSLPRQHLADAVRFAETHRIPLSIVKTEEMANPSYIKNDGGRCFHCKDELFGTLKRVAQETGISTIAYGRNLDDDADYRPGQQAASLHGAVAPLAAAKLHKQEIRTLARGAELDVWDKPSAACLSSRIEHGRPVTEEALRQVEAAEEHLARLGFRQVRVRHHGDVARIEIDRGDMEMALTLTMLDRITAGVRAAGFVYVSLDTEGYRSGSMNALVPVEQLLRQGSRHAT